MISDEELSKFIENSINDYHKKILDKLLALKLNIVLKRKNPYLFKVKGLNSSQDLVKSILDAHLSSQEEAIFGGVLEELAIFICNKVYGGVKSAAEGIDLEFEKDDRKYIVSIKSGPHWGNANSIKKLRDHFKKAKRILGTNAAKQNVVAINGCCYGQDRNPDKGDYVKLCGQEFWEHISGDDTVYLKIIEPIGLDAQNRNDAFNVEYEKVLERFNVEFTKDFCNDAGEINWDKLLQYNSGSN